MPFFDRYWWLQAIAPVMALIIGAGCVTPLIVEMFQLDTELGDSHTTTIALASAVAIMLVVLTTVIAGRSIYAHQRLLLRRRALAGDLSAMPLSTIAVDAAATHTDGNTELTIMWRPSVSSRFLAAIGLLLLLLTLTVLGVIIVAAVLHLGQAQPFQLVSSGSMSGWWFPLLPSIAIGMWAGIRFLRGIPDALGWRSGVLVSDAGVTWRTRWRKCRFLNWSDTCLLEVRPIGSLKQGREYILYGCTGRTFVRWYDHLYPVQLRDAASSKPKQVPDGSSDEEMRQRLREMLTLVHQHTGLTPRTLYRPLQPSDTFKQSKQFSVVASATWFVGGLLMIGIGILAALFPLVASARSLTLLSAIAFGLAGVLMVITAMIAPLMANRAVVTESPLLDEDTSGQALPSALFLRPGEAYVLPIGFTRPLRWGLALFGVLLIVGGVPACVYILSQSPINGAVPLPWASVQPTSLSDTLAQVFFLVAGVGVMLLGRATLYGRSPLREIRADASGLHLRFGRLRSDLPWNAVESLTLETRQGRAYSYYVKGDSGKVAFRWLSAPPPASGIASTEQVVSPGMLAAVVVQRSGVVLQTEELDQSGASA